jgi:hypothetical protein
MPHFAERFTANVAHKYQIVDAPPVPPTKGSIYKPIATGTGVLTTVFVPGWKKNMSKIEKVYMECNGEISSIKMSA